MPDAAADQASYLRDGAAIYHRSFAIIRAEADLSRFTAEQAEIELSPAAIPTVIARDRGAFEHGFKPRCGERDKVVALKHAAGFTEEFDAAKRAAT